MNAVHQEVRIPPNAPARIRHQNMYDIPDNEIRNVAAIYINNMNGYIQ